MIPNLNKGNCLNLDISLHRADPRRNCHYLSGGRPCSGRFIFT
jgi:hypothetical protein